MIYHCLFQNILACAVDIAKNGPQGFFKVCMQSYLNFYIKTKMSLSNYLYTDLHMVLEVSFFATVLFSTTVLLCGNVSTDVHEVVCELSLPSEELDRQLIMGIEMWRWGEGDLATSVVPKSHK